MPILKYRCNDCGNIFEELVLSSDAKVHCSACKSNNIIRHYQGKCYTSPSGGGSCSGSCSGCSGCS
ncbi:MAG: zinc ribbon domain-containing protein [Clostridia bacterium]|nr:zinc ribbon domain-containing protein [Clostridia bacterium]